jgi:hypothetical protein
VCDITALLVQLAKDQAHHTSEVSPGMLKAETQLGN